MFEVCSCGGPEAYAQLPTLGVNRHSAVRLDFTASGFLACTQRGCLSHITAEKSGVEPTNTTRAALQAPLRGRAVLLQLFLAFPSLALYNVSLASFLLGCSISNLYDITRCSSIFIFEVHARFHMLNHTFTLCL